MALWFWSFVLKEFPNFCQTVMFCSVSCVSYLIALKQNTTELRPPRLDVHVDCPSRGVDFRMKGYTWLKIFAQHSGTTTTMWTQQKKTSASDSHLWLCQRFFYSLAERISNFCTALPTLAKISDYTIVYAKNFVFFGKIFVLLWKFQGQFLKQLRSYVNYWLEVRGYWQELSYQP